MDDEYSEYRCSACKKAIKSQIVTCKSCTKLFYHPGCVVKHKVYDKNKELVACPGPFERFTIESDREVINMNKVPVVTGSSSSRARLGSIGSTGSLSGAGGSSGSGSSIDVKIDAIFKMTRELKNEMVGKDLIKTMIKEVVAEELGNVKQELENLKKILQGAAYGSKEGSHRSYSAAVKEKKENVIIVKPKLQQESEDTKKVIKEKVDIKSMAMGITKLKKGSGGTVIMGCETGEEVKKLKETVQAELGENYKVMEPPQSKPKIKIINIDLEEMNLDDNEFLNTIKKQNKIDTGKMRIVKRMSREKRNNQGRGSEEGSIIMEADEETHKLLLKKAKLNVGWRKCPVFNHINVKRCFKCWGYYHIAKNCTRDETCYKCAGNHNSRDCTAAGKKCVNCMYKNRSYNLKISEDHDALNPECPTFKRALQEEKRRAGWQDDK